MKTLAILYKKTNSGASQQWQIIVKEDTFYTRSGQVGGKITESKPTKCLGKNLGKKNETSPATQALLEAEAKWKKKIKENYKEDISKIEEKLFFAPMLAEKFTKYQNKIKYPILVQEKLNGIRCIITVKGAFSRKGEEFHCIDHIKKSVAPLFKNHPDLILDGELYNPIYKNQLNQIAKLVSVNRKPKDITADDIKKSEEIVQYHVYDGLNLISLKSKITNKTPYKDRHSALSILLKTKKYVYVLDYVQVDDEEDIFYYLKQSKLEQKEGIIIRLPDSGYENKRSKNLLKLKNFQDCEFEVIDLKEGAGNWAGCVKIVTCKLNEPATDGRTEFDSNIRGTQSELAELWNNKKKYIGQLATVEYQEMSEFKIPLIPYTRLPWRNYE